jgi:hypothetical protein
VAKISSNCTSVKANSRLEERLPPFITNVILNEVKDDVPGD